jgi:glutamate--cysteine ligase
MAGNQLAVVERGRAPGLMLKTGDGEKPLQIWAEEVFAGIRPLAALLDELHGDDLYTYSLDQQVAKLVNPDLTPSARMLEIMRSQRIPYFRFVMNQSIAHKGYFDEHPLRDRALAEFQRIATESIARQHEVEATDDVDFDTFLESYLAFK